MMTQICLCQFCGLLEAARKQSSHRGLAEGEDWSSLCSKRVLPSCAKLTGNVSSISDVHEFNCAVFSRMNTSEAVPPLPPPHRSACALFIIADTVPVTGMSALTNQL
ncbi:hypothetical protein J6590_059539 [Homalodisca vitripennis]|nr:hypothetical protein J6590_059539 [Homalodisca vitripennis]